MEKLVENLNVRDYDEVEDIIFELLQEHYGIERYSFEYLEKDVEYVVGAINIVKLGDIPNTLKHRNHNNEWSDDIAITESYEYATYYRLDKLNELCKNVLSGSWSETYNFRKILNEQ
jgi:hypothetical protein